MYNTILKSTIQIKKYWALLPLCGLLACGDTTGGATGDTGGGDRRVEDLGRLVSGSRRMSEYYQYSLPCDYINQSSLVAMFGLEEGAELTWTDSEAGCEVSVNNKKLVLLSTTSPRPFESVFHAEYYFDRLYDPSALDNRGRKQFYTGPEPEGTGAESPSGGVGNPATGNQAAVAGAPTDSTQVHSEPGVPPNAQLDDNDEMRSGSQPVPGAWEKAVWNPKTRTLHILNLEHVFHVTVNHGPTLKADSLHAAQLGSLLVKQVDVETDRGEDPIY
ncbi:hypothetical protein ACFQ4C_05545 [Larkinella insperata]|uniref:Uncharacterized protein n=1 Tax=Larkinella insperata TaxID=332158 RepID=A0ABW3PZV8_9BACT|nr:hypothetical protein [Larkinella insperata]